MMPLPLPMQTLAWLNQAADAGQCDAQVMLYLLDRADVRDRDVARFLDSYTATIAALCRRLEALERTAGLRHPNADAKGTQSDSVADDAAPTSAASTPLPAALVERVASALGPFNQAAMDDGELPFGTASAAIREVAAWLDIRGQHGCSALLREEIDR